MATHILLSYPSNNTDVLFRASDGIGIAQRKGVMVIIGEDPNKGTSRIFIDEKLALNFLTEFLPMADLAGLEMDYKFSAKKIADPKPEVIIERRSGEGLILHPKTTDLPNQIRKIN